MKELHQRIYKLLVDSKLAANTQSMIVLELKESQILYNEQKLDAEVEGALNAVLLKYNLKRKDYRMIKLSEHSISIGDYRPGSFTGVFQMVF